MPWFYKKWPTTSRSAAREYNSAFVLMHYFAYLRRDPDAAGFHFWLYKLNRLTQRFASRRLVNDLRNGSINPALSSVSRTRPEGYRPHGYSQVSLIVTYPEGAKG